MAFEADAPLPIPQGRRRPPRRRFGPRSEPKAFPRGEGRLPARQPRPRGVPRSRRRLIFAELPAVNHRADRCCVTRPAAPLHSITRQGHASRPAPCMIALGPSSQLPPSLLQTSFPSWFLPFLPSSFPVCLLPHPCPLHCFPHACTPPSLVSLQPTLRPCRHAHRLA